MKFFLKYCIILLLGVCYFSVTLEVLEAERKLNYEKESHTYIHAEKETETRTVKTVKHPDVPVQFINYCHHYLIASEKGNSSVFPFYKDTPPPEGNKLYLYHSVFLI